MRALVAAHPFRPNGGRRHQDQGLYPFRLLDCQPERQFAAERVAHQVETLKAQVGHGLCHGQGELRHGLGALVSWRCAEARHFEDNDPILCGE